MPHSGTSSILLFVLFSPLPFSTCLNPRQTCTSSLVVSTSCSASTCEPLPCTRPPFAHFPPPGSSASPALALLVSYKLFKCSPAAIGQQASSAQSLPLAGLLKVSAMLFITARSATFPQPHHHHRLTNFQIWNHHTAAGHTMDKASGPATRNILSSPLARQRPSLRVTVPRLTLLVVDLATLTSTPCMYSHRIQYDLFSESCTI